MAFDGYGMPSVDFSTLGKLGDIYDKGKLSAGRERSLAALGQGASLADVSRSLFQAGDIEGGTSLARLADVQAQRAQTQAFQKAQIENMQESRKLQERGLGIQERGLEEKPTYQVIEDNSGNKHIIQMQPLGRGTKDVTPPEISSSTGGNPFAAGGSMKEHEGKSALFADRAATAHKTITENENINTGAGNIGGIAEKILPEAVTNVITSPQRGMLMNSKRAFINALLRRESGAAINAGEFVSYDKEYFPQVGDTKEQLDAKRRHRAEVISGLARESGKAYRPKYTVDEATGNVKFHIDDAREAIAAGADRGAVIKRLREMGVSPAGL